MCSHVQQDVMNFDEFQVSIIKQKRMIPSYQRLIVIAGNKESASVE